MRINHPDDGDKRTRTFFAWYPVHSKNNNQTRWFEVVTVVETYTYTPEGSGWRINNFVDITETS